jgi:anthranilate phosphoribosyltransferase
MSDTIKNAINEICAGRNLSSQLTTQIMQEIFRGEVNDISKAGWLTAMHTKGETPDELAACIKVMRDGAVKIQSDDASTIDIVGTGGDGHHTYNISTSSAFVAAGAGAKVAKHGNRAFSSKSGSADVLSHLGINTQISPEKMAECLKEIGMTFLFAPLLHPAVKHTIEVRKTLGVRTLFNLLGPMCNPAGVRRGLIGVYSEKYAKVMANSAAVLGVDHMLFAYGQDGMDEISICAPTKVFEVKGSQVNEFTLSPQDFDFKTATHEDIRGGEPQQNADALRNLLGGEKSPYRDAVLLNAGAGIYTSGKVSSIAEGIEVAAQSIDSGSALTILEKLSTSTNA